MKTHKLTKLFAALLAFALFASACGGDDGGVSSDDQAMVDAVAAAIEREGDFPTSVDIDCMAKATVKGFGGTSGMIALGLSVEAIEDGQDVTDAELPRDDAVAMADDMFECGLVNAFADEIAEDLPADDAKCIAENLDQDALRDMMASEFVGGAEGDTMAEDAEGKMLSSMFGAMADCEIDPSALGG